jgi:hypothetical protein
MGVTSGNQVGVGEIMAVTFKREYKARDRLKQRLAELDGKTIEWGIFSDSVYNDEERKGLPVAAVAWWNHEGANQPRRPFFDNMIKQTFPMKNNLSPMARYRLNKMYKGILFETIGVTPAIDNFANYLVEKLKSNIKNYSSLGTIHRSNAKSWAAVKGHDDPLMWKGTLYNSIKHKIV